MIGDRAHDRQPQASEQQSASCGTAPEPRHHDESWEVGERAARDALGREDAHLPDIERYYIPAGEGAAEIGLAWLADEGRRAGAATLWAPTVVDLDAIERELSRAADRKLIRAVVSGRSASAWGIVVHRVTARGGTYSNGPVLAFWPDDEEMERIERAPAVCAVSWPTVLALRGWEARHKPIDVASGQPINPDTPPASPVALETLKSIKLHGIHNGLERPYVAAALNVLALGGIPIDREAMRIAAIIQGWPAHVAHDLAKLIDTMKKGTRVRLDQRRDWGAEYDRWVTQAADRRTRTSAGEADA